MSILDAFAHLTNPYAPSSSSDPSPGLITDREDGRWAELGSELADDSARYLGLRRAFLSGSIDPAGRRSILARVVVAGRNVMRSIGDLLSTGGQVLSGWYRAMREAIGTHVYAGILSQLGPAELPPADRLNARTILGTQVGYLDRFRADLESGDVPLTRSDGEPNGQVGNRSANYGSAAWAAGINAHRLRMARDGYASERRVLGSVESGHCPECPPLAGLGWRPIGSLPAIGETVCRLGCLCYYLFS